MGEPGTTAPPDTSTYYTVTHPEHQTTDWKAFYDHADRLTDVTRDAVPHHLDVAYGDHPKQRLDVYVPNDASGPAPVIVFIHGGGFREGDRRHYGFVARPFADVGMVTVVPSYRLLPEFDVIASIADIQAVLAWIAGNGISFGARPSGVVVAGHSAGAVLAARVGCDRAWLRDQGLADELLGGVAAVSGAYDFTDESLPSYARERLTDLAARSEASPILNVRHPVPRALVAVGERESGYLGPSRAFAAELEANDVATVFEVLDGLGHDGTVLALGEEDSLLFGAVRQLVTQ